jgi:hypothetical protein
MNYVPDNLQRHAANQADYRSNSSAERRAAVEDLDAVYSANRQASYSKSLMKTPVLNDKRNRTLAAVEGPFSHCVYAVSTDIY